jgi:hypothetical protein
MAGTTILPGKMTNTPAEAELAGYGAAGFTPPRPVGVVPNTTPGRAPLKGCDYGPRLALTRDDAGSASVVDISNLAYIVKVDARLSRFLRERLRT